MSDIRQWLRPFLEKAAIAAFISLAFIPLSSRFLAIEGKYQKLIATARQLGFHWNSERKCWQHPCGRSRPRSDFRLGLSGPGVGGEFRHEPVTRKKPAGRRECDCSALGGSRCAGSRPMGRRYAAGPGARSRSVEYA